MGLRHAVDELPLDPVAGPPVGRELLPQGQELGPPPGRPVGRLDRPGRPVAGPEFVQGRPLDLLPPGIPPSDAKILSDSSGAMPGRRSKSSRSRSMMSFNVR